MMLLVFQLIIYTNFQENEKINLQWILDEKEDFG